MKLSGIGGVEHERIFVTRDEGAFEGVIVDEVDFAIVRFLKRTTGAGEIDLADVGGLELNGRGGIGMLPADFVSRADSEQFAVKKITVGKKHAVGGVAQWDRNVRQFVNNCRRIEEQDAIALDLDLSAAANNDALARCAEAGGSEGKEECAEFIHRHLRIRRAQQRECRRGVCLN